MKKSFCNHIVIFILFLVSFRASAQYIQVNDNYTAQQLVNALVSGGCAQVYNVSVNGWTGGSGSPSFGYFTANGSGFPFANGIVLSSGFAASAPGPNNSLLSQGSTAWGGDPDLEAALGVGGTINATVLEFDFIPFTNNISFDYIFASEQYLTSINSPNQCNYTDGFAFLLKEVGSAGPYQNLAVVPGTNTPVRVNTVRGAGVCPAANPEYFDRFNPTNAPVNFNGQTVILAAKANVVPGTPYHIKLVVADQGNNLYDSAIFLGGGSFNSVTELGDDRLLARGDALCAGKTLELDATTPGATGYQWYNGINAIPGETSATYTVRAQGDYSVRVQFTTTCYSEGDIRIEYNPPLPGGSYTLLQCDENNDGLTTYNLALAGDLAVNGDTSLMPSYFRTLGDANGNIDAIDASIPFSNTVSNQVIYVRLENQAGCYGVATVTLSTSANTVSNAQAIELCDTIGPEDGFTEFDLTQRDADILTGLPAGLQVRYYTSYQNALTETNPIADPATFTNTVANNQTIYARVYNASDCYGIARFQLTVFTFGNLPDQSVTLCSDVPSILLTAPAGYTNYQWNTTPVTTGQTLTVTAPGTYTVNLTNSNLCTGTKTYIVTASGTATGADIDVVEFADDNNSITITPQGIGNYEYSLDGITYQASNYFNGLSPGEYPVFIRDINGCGPPFETSVYVLDYPRFFTPNGDGINDYWRIPLMNFQPAIRVSIFDRFGKLITGFRGNSLGWDGKHDGRPLPATDYWFVIQLPNGRIIKGHFSLLR